MNEVNKTLYIPLYGKALVNKRGIILEDAKAEEIWEKEQFPLKGKSASKWLAFYMAMRAWVFDTWVTEALKENPDAMVLHIGCGMDSRILRVGTELTDTGEKRSNENSSDKNCSDENCSNESSGPIWYDIDFPEVIAERKKYYKETESYTMFGADASKTDWITELPSDKKAIIIMEGISMYLPFTELVNLLDGLNQHFPEVKLLMDCYTVFAAKVSKYKNPIKEVGVSVTYGVDEPLKLAKEAGISFIKEHTMTPDEKVDELQGFERKFFKNMMAGKVAEKLYRLYEFAGKK
ncbi:MAG: class I SAM-dependent methyltransferase [Lachnospiraceae bacterium]|nr:class I SAM-dependent methyltransferase [Lachnospiraceae bacterium]